MRESKNCGDKIEFVNNYEVEIKVNGIKSNLLFDRSDSGCITCAPTMHNPLIIFSLNASLLFIYEVGLSSILIIHIFKLV